jgi:hypothetical protein
VWPGAKTACRQLIKTAIGYDFSSVGWAILPVSPPLLDTTSTASGKSAQPTLDPLQTGLLE